MGWGRSKAPAAPPSALSQIFPLLILLLVVAGLGWIGYQVYLSVAKIQQTASQKMGKKNVVFTKDGLKVGVKQVKDEHYVDATQSWVVKAWNLGSDAQKEEVEKKKQKKAK
ncbi:hypothetical protein GE09DRAFT_1294061 [Coniochaeta sp. 2T2.1]|nr:hypothetical protein GE09DRAFT_1294061 [Coniochaeta sp. 2T2.1]